MVKKRKSAGERKEQILEEALKLFLHDNYSFIVMDDIAKACHIARTTLYEYYSNKEEILIALAEKIAYLHMKCVKFKFTESHVWSSLNIWRKNILQRSRETKAYTGAYFKQLQ